MPCPYAKDLEAQAAYRDARLASIAISVQCVSRHAAGQRHQAGQMNYQPGYAVPYGEGGNGYIIELLAMARNDLDAMLESFTGTHPRDNPAWR